MDKHPIENIMDSTLSNIRTMIDVNTIIGSPIVTGDTTIIPISKLSFGFVSGGGEYAEKPNSNQAKANNEQEKDFPFAGGTGAGVSVTPSAFLVVSKDCTRLLPVSESTIYDRLIDLAPQVFEEIKTIINNSSQDDVNPTPDHSTPSDELL